MQKTILMIVAVALVGCASTTTENPTPPVVSTPKVVPNSHKAAAAIETAIRKAAGKEVSSQVLAAPGKEQVAVAFSSTLEPKQKRAYRIYFDNPKAKAAVYQTDLTSQPVAGFVKIEPRRPFALSIRNKQLRVDLHPKSGQIGKMAFPWEPFQATLD